MELIKEVTKDIPNVEIVSFNGLLIEFSDKMKADVIVRGIRAVSDFEYELMMAQTNKQLNPNIETMFCYQRRIFFCKFQYDKRTCRI